ncbi:integrin alpha [Patescibacteria group bacterium]
MLSASANQIRKLGASRQARKRVLGMVVSLAVAFNGLFVPLPVRSVSAAETAVEPAPIEQPLNPEDGLEGSDWYAEALANLAAMEYGASVDAGGSDGEDLPPGTYHLGNRAQNLRSYVGPGGWTVVPREGEGDWSWSYRLRSLGRGGEASGLLEVPAPEDVSGDENVLFVSYGPALDEWFLNAEDGVKQNYLIWERPAGEGALELTAEIDTDLVAWLNGSAHMLFGTEPGAATLALGGLEAYDDTGRELYTEFRFDPDGSTLTVSVDDSGAVYPIVIDPLATSPDWTDESDQDTAYFGRSVSSAGDVNGDGYDDVLVGAVYYDNDLFDEGRVFLYYGSDSGVSTTADWTAESDQAYSKYGFATASAGDVNGDGYDDVIVGAEEYDNGELNEGRAFVYYGSASGLSASADWTAESDQAHSSFGYSVASAGDVNGDGYDDVIVGAYKYDNGQADEGGAFLYYGSASGPSASPDWARESNQGNAQYGKSVASAGDVNGDGYDDVIVGCDYYGNGQSAEGRAFVYHGSASGPSLTADWYDESDQAYAYFGVSVSSAGDVNGDGYGDVIVGAMFYDNGEDGEGGAFVYHGSGSGLSATPDWTAESNQTTALFGYSVSSAGDVNGDGYGDVIVGASNYSNGQTNEGRGYVYCGSAAGLFASVDWTYESDQTGAAFGYSVSSAGDVNGDGYGDVIVGAYGYDGGTTDEGRAFLFSGSGSGLHYVAAWTAESDQVSAYLGNSVSSAGDVNGDGYGDVIVGAFYFDNGQEDEGRAYVFLGSRSGLSGTPDWTAEPDQANAYFGKSVSSAGDVNGDGYGDVIVGAVQYDADQTNEGRAFVYHGSASGLSDTPDWTGDPTDQINAWFGNSVSSAGDVNDDGYDDVIVAAYSYNNGQTDEGSAYVFLGSASGLSSTPDWTDESDQASSYYGMSVSSAGDVDGDGYDDVIVGAYGYDNGQTDEGRAYVYLGSESGPSATPDWTAEADQTYANLGYSVSSAGDVNGDGYGDVVVGALNYDDGQTDEGRAYLFLGSASGLSATADWTAAPTDQDNARFGASVSSAGDVNGDGYGDVVVGAQRFTETASNEGRAYLFLGSASGLAAAASWTADPADQSSVYFGFPVSSAGDVNGDGFDDVIVGAYPYDNGQNDEGRAYLYYGYGPEEPSSGLPDYVEVTGPARPVENGHPTVVNTLRVSPDVYDGDGVKLVELLLDGEAYHVCAYDGPPYPTAPTCSYPLGTLPRGRYDLTTRVTDANDAVTSETEALVVAGFTTGNNARSGRLAAGATDVELTFSFELAGTSGSSDDLVLEFPAGFTVKSVTGTGSHSCILNLTLVDSDTVSGNKVSCPPNTPITVAGIFVDLPSTPDIYDITWSNDYGQIQIPVLDDDQITVLSNVDPSITFDIDVSTTDVETAAPYLVDLGEISTVDTRVSGGTDGVRYIWIDFETNGTGGGTVTVLSENGAGGLVSLSVPTDNIPNAAAAVDDGTENYGLCVVAVTEVSGASLARAGDYVALTCADDTEGNTVAALSDSTPSDILTASAALEGGRAQIAVQAAIDTTTDAHDDYADVLTFIGTAEF